MSRVVTKGPYGRAYRDWHIAPGDWTGWDYWHDGYDGAEDAGDNRAGNAATLDEALDAIDEWEADNAPDAAAALLRERGL